MNYLETIICFQLCTYKKEHEPSPRAASETSSSPSHSPEVDPAELKKIKKVQVDAYKLSDSRLLKFDLKKLVSAMVDLRASFIIRITFPLRL